MKNKVNKVVFIFFGIMYILHMMSSLFGVKTFFTTAFYYISFPIGSIALLLVSILFRNMGIETSSNLSGTVQFAFYYFATAIQWIIIFKVVYWLRSKMKKNIDFQK